MFANRVLAVTEDVMFTWRMPVEQGRRDTRDYVHAGVTVVNPWHPSARSA